MIFPFEEKFYRDWGVDAEFAGHPLAELPRPTISRDEFAVQHGLDPAKLWITLMPGSRVKEVRMNLPGILAAAEILGAGYEFLLPVAATVDAGLIARITQLSSDIQIRGEAGEGILRQAQDRLRPYTSSSAAGSVHLVPEALPALAHSRAGIIASGTATVEAAMMEAPFVMVYRVTPLTYLLGRSTVKVPHFAMVNLIAGEEIVPELVQRDFSPERVAAEVHKIIPDGDPREKMLNALRRVRDLLRGRGNDTHPADRAAQAVIKLLAK